MYNVHLCCLFIDIHNWIRKVEQYANEGVNKILIGNKCDILERKVITTEQGKALATEYGLSFLETSAKSNINVEDAFYKLARDIKKRLIDTAEEPSGAGNYPLGGDNININNGGNSNSSSSCCQDIKKRLIDTAEEPSGAGNYPLGGDNININNGGNSNSSSSCCQ
ncbi:Ras-related protein Rab-8A [Smittium culicis]|uniref:Ras-related protein Rab-8A n=1 Tax=Smittium culicis TaxID=133412 RepID=A0A1R1Y829_9FUNG|nr:Ras-related protein Rab-8A [Smittium culicis]